MCPLFPPRFGRWLSLSLALVTSKRGNSVCVPVHLGSESYLDSLAAVISQHTYSFHPTSKIVKLAILVFKPIAASIKFTTKRRFHNRHQARSFLLVLAVSPFHPFPRTSFVSTQLPQ